MLVRVAPGVHHRTIGDEVVLIDPTGTTYFSLNATASVAWEQLNASGSVADAVAAVGAIFAHAPATLVDDVYRLVRELLAAGLLSADAVSG